LGDSEVDVLLFDKVIFSKGTSGVTLIEYKRKDYLTSTLKIH